MKVRISTEHFKHILNEQTSTQLYFNLSENINWVEGVRSKKGFTRLGYICDFDEIPAEIMNCVTKSLKMYSSKRNCPIEGVNIRSVYLNYYVNGDYWCPNHTHKNTIQIVLSLGTTRTLNVGKKQFSLSNGDLVIFGSSVHGIQKEVVDTSNIFGGGRISIAFFVDPLYV